MSFGFLWVLKIDSPTTDFSKMEFGANLEFSVSRSAGEGIANFFQKGLWEVVYNRPGFGDYLC